VSVKRLPRSETARAKRSATWGSSTDTTRVPLLPRKQRPRSDWLSSKTPRKTPCMGSRGLSIPDFRMREIRNTFSRASPLRKASATERGMRSAMRSAGLGGVVILAGTCFLV
jgi:hypothetical protein